jgi:hypothetical protein
MINQYAHQEENLRVVDTGKSKFKIVREAFGNGLWHIEVDAGSVPAVLREQSFTRHSYAYDAIKNYLDGHAERQIVYKKVPKKED